MPLTAPRGLGDASCSPAWPPLRPLPAPSGAGVTTKVLRGARAVPRALVGCSGSRASEEWTWHQWSSASGHGQICSLDLESSVESPLFQPNGNISEGWKAARARCG